MLTLQPKQVKILLFASICLCGLSAGYFTAQLSGYLLQPPPSIVAEGGQDHAASPRPATVDVGLILNRNIFNPAARGQTAKPIRPDTAEPVATGTRSDLKLTGTVEGGATPLALIESGGKAKIYKIGATLPGGGELLSVSRNEALVRQPDGSRAKLTIARPESHSTSSTASSEISESTESGEAGDGIKNLGDNRWAVSRDEVAKARANMNELLKSARLEPNIINGQTEGFVVKMIRPKSLLSQLGIQRGDTITRVNSVELNSPEKALQIFQQLREAKRLTVDLKRGSENLTFDYEVN